mgnify:CR=1 FL=1|jgi:hypothetical protein
MNYKIVTNPGHFFDVVETKTSQIVYTSGVHSKAKELLRHLNFGGGFDGFTPSFMLKNIAFKTKK